MLDRDEVLELAPEGFPVLIGDISLAYETCVREAAEKGLPLESHAAHLVVHGLLHLAGFDHELSADDASAMEALEIKALALLGIADPYGDADDAIGA
jgi:probable rRNA maturation factor